MKSSSSNPVSCPETSIKIYGSKEEIRARKSPETVDAPGFAPDASIPVILYGADDQIRTDYLVLTKDALYLLSYISELAGAEGFEPSARGFGVDVEKALTDIQQPVFRAPYFKGSHQVFQHLRLAGQLFASCGAALGVIRVAVHHA